MVKVTLEFDAIWIKSTVHLALEQVLDRRGMRLKTFDMQAVAHGEQNKVLLKVTGIVTTKQGDPATLEVTSSKIEEWLMQRVLAKGYKTEDMAAPPTVTCPVALNDERKDPVYSFTLK